MSYCVKLWPVMSYLVCGTDGFSAWREFLEIALHEIGHLATWEIHLDLPYDKRESLAWGWAERAMARALATKPKLLLLDEPIAGMNPDEIDFTMRAILLFRAQGI